MAFDLDDAGRIRRIRPHPRPWLTTTLFARLLIPRIGSHPGLVLRALQRAQRGRKRVVTTLFTNSVGRIAIIDA